MTKGKGIIKGKGMIKGKEIIKGKEMKEGKEIIKEKGKRKQVRDPVWDVSVCHSWFVVSFSTCDNTTESNTSKMRILVTGGAGFLGFHLCRRLLNEGHTVICVDNLCSGEKRHADMLAVFSASQETQRGVFEFHELDVCDNERLTEAVGEKADKKIDQIFHMACPASPKFYQMNPIETLRSCFEGTINVLRLAERQKAPIMMASTSEVYGDPEQHPQKESYWGHVNPFGPRSCYDEGKRVAEALCFSFIAERGVNVKVVRIFNVYGPEMRPDDGRVVSNFICLALRNLPLPVYGGGHQTRSFCFVDDAVEAFIRSLPSSLLIFDL